MLLARRTGLSHRIPLTAAVALSAFLAGILVIALTRAKRSKRRRAYRRPPAKRLRGLCQAITGVDKQTIACVLGQPAATGGARDLSSAKTWYYRLDLKRRVALAIEFDRDIAKQTRVLQGVGGRR
jgi:hypothetical protein